MKAGGSGPSHSKRKTTCLIVLQSLCSGAPRSAWVATVHIFGIFFFSFFFIFSLFFVRAAGAGSGTLKVKTLKGMLSYACYFATWDACRRSESEEWPSLVRRLIRSLISHTVDISPVHHLWPMRISSLGDRAFMKPCRVSGGGIPESGLDVLQF